MKFLRMNSVATRIARSFCVTSRQTSNSVKFSTLDEEMKSESSMSSSSLKNNPSCSYQDQTLQSNSVPNPVKDFVLFHRPTRQVVDLNADSTQNQLSIFFTKREELVDVKFSEKFRQSVEAIHEAEKENVRNLEAEDSSLQSIDDLLWKKEALEWRQLPAVYMKLAKIRLTGLVVVTSMAGYALAPGAFDPKTFAFVTLGTALTSASANAVNQFLEVPFDSQMQRTKQRPLVKGQISALHAVSFAAAAGVAGSVVLLVGVNPIVAGLGVFNLFLYTAVYTPMKRLSTLNTWVGSVVGAVPPMMGWAAATGSLEPGAWVLAAIMYAWQFPHFCALSWNLRPDYSRAGYRMMSVVDPDLCRRTSLRYSVGMTGICTLVPYFGVTTWTFAIDSLPLNAYLAYLGYRFYRDGDSNSSRKLFRFSLIHIPALIVLMLISKKQYGSIAT